jgi:hypothetical protein
MNIKSGDKLIAIIDALPVNLRASDIEICKILKGEVVTLQKVGKPYNNTTLITLDLERKKSVFSPLYYASAFQKVEEVNDVPVYYKIE